MEIFDSLCRACNTEQTNLFKIDQQNDAIPIKNMLEYCLQTPIHSGPMYPELICYFCVKQLEIAYRFLQRYKLAQKEFEKSFEHIKNIQDADNEGEKVNNMEEISEEFEKNECNEYELPEHPQIIDAIKIKSSDRNITFGHMESIINKEKQNGCTAINTTKSKTLPANSCSICKKIFFTSKALNLHLKINHKEKNLSKNLNKSKMVENDTEMEYTNSFDTAKHCAMCNTTFFTINALNLHLKLAHKLKITIT